MRVTERYDTIIIGAGLSGIAAAIRLGHYGRRVLLVERHRLPGGLNSYYRHHGRLVDTGLHAVTNFCAPGDRQAPLNRLLRQLRIPRTALDPCEQESSAIGFPGAELRFTNTFSALERQVAERFPSQADGFRALSQAIQDLDLFALDAASGSARGFLGQYIDDPLLRDMILCPVMFYGNAMTDDMDLNQFCIMFRSIFQEGFWRPREGMRHVLNTLMGRLSETEARTRFGCGVRRICLEDGCATGVVLDDGTELRAGGILSSAGYPETIRLCGGAVAAGGAGPAGVMSFIETVFFLERAPAELGLADAIRFVCDAPRFHYHPPEAAVDFSSGVVCVPENFQGCSGTYADGHVRITHMANHRIWEQMDRDGYDKAKKDTVSRQIEAMETRYPGFRDAVTDWDMFTPCTVTRYTGHLNGTVYGSPAKHKDGRTPVANLFVCGTDQGFLGIVGSLLSGISMANLHFLG